MKNLLKYLLLLLVFFYTSSVQAWEIDYFKIEFNTESIWVWEALDLTITALDKNDEVVSDYTGNVFGFSETDDKVELPAELADDDWYSFTLSDGWIKKFENWIKFNTVWEQSISLYDANDYENVTWKWKVNVIASAQWNSKEDRVEIEILSPESDMTLGKSDVKVSWATKRNHAVRITLNNTEVFNTTSNSDWIFEKDIDWFVTWKNTIKAVVLDSDENIIWESSDIIVNIDDSKPRFKKIVLSPLPENWEVEENTNIDVKVFANKWLKSVKILFNDGVISLSETEDGVYTWSFKTPSEEKKFGMDVILVDDLWHSVTEKDIAEIKVFLVELKAAPPEEKPEVKEVEEVEEEEEPNLEIWGLKLVKLKNKSILTWDKLEDAKSYDVLKSNEETGKFEFVTNVVEPKFEIEITWDEIKYQYFAVKAKTETNSWEVIHWDLSQATEIQTWPTETIIMLILSLILGFIIIFIRRRFKNS